jgi:hypothetical protein
MYNLLAIYQEIQNTMGNYLKLFRLGKQEDLTPEQIMKLVQMSDSIYKLQDRLEHLENEVLDISRRKSEGQEELKNLRNEISNTKEKLDTVKRTFNIKYEELKEACSQAQKLQNYVEQFRNSQDYQELESVVRSEAGNSLSDNKKLLQNALFSVLLALRKDPARYLIIDRMELTPFTTNTIINRDSFSMRGPSYGNEQFSVRVLEMGERILYNLQKSIVDSTISTAAGLEKESSYPATRLALPYYEYGE